MPYIDVPDSENPYIAGCIEHTPPVIVSSSPYAVSFVVDGFCKFIPTYTLARGAVVEIRRDEWEGVNDQGTTDLREVPGEPDGEDY